MRKTLCFITILLVAICMFYSCEKDPTGSSYEYEGNWEGTTSQDLPVSFHVSSDGFIDELDVTLDCDTYNEQLSGTGKIENDSCKIIISNQGNINKEYMSTDLEIIFDSAKIVRGYIDHTWKDRFSNSNGSTITVGYTVKNTVYFTAYKE